MLGFQVNSALEYLYLANNPIHAAGAAGLARGLAANRKLVPPECESGRPSGASSLAFIFLMLQC